MGQPAEPETAPRPAAPANLEPAVAALASRNRLGGYRQTLPPHKRWRLVIVTAILALIFLVVGGVLAFVAVTEPQAADGVVSVVVGTLVATVPFGFFVWAVLSSPVFSQRVRGRQIHVFEDGYVRITGHGPHVYRWGDVRTVYQEIATTYDKGHSSGTKYRFRITFEDGRVETLNTYTTDMAIFGPLVQAEIARAQVPQARQLLRSGQSVAFGHIVLSDAGLAAGRKGPVPWAEIRGVQVFQGRLRVLRRGKRTPFASTPAKKIPNLYTFLALANESTAAH